MGKGTNVSEMTVDFGAEDVELDVGVGGFCELVEDFEGGVKLF